MDIKLPKDLEQRLTRSVRRYLAEAFGEDVGELKASLFLKFCLEEIAPSAYNLAIADARAYLQEKVEDLENVCFAEEERHWTRQEGRKGVARKPDARR